MNKKPVWIKSQKTGETQIQLLNGQIAVMEELQQLVFWPSVRLRISFGGGYREYKTHWRKQVSDFVCKLTNLAKFSWMHQETIPGSHWTAAVLRPIPFDKISVEKLITKNIFHAYPEDPIMLLRTGDKFDVHYESGLLIYHDKIEFYLPPTQKNVQFLEKLADDLVKNKLMGKISFQYADLSYGLTGWTYDFTKLKITKNFTKIVYPEKNSPIFGSRWLVWIGDLWQATEKHRKILEIFRNNPIYKIEKHNNLEKITTTQPSSHEDTKHSKSAKKLSEDLNNAIKKLSNLDFRLLQPVIDRDMKTLVRKLRNKHGKEAKSNALRALKKKYPGSIVMFPGQQEAEEEIANIIKKDFKKAKGTFLCIAIKGKQIFVRVKNKLVKGKAHFVIMSNIENFEDHFDHRKPMFEQIVKENVEMETTIHLAPIRSKKDLEGFTAR